MKLNYEELLYFYAVISARSAIPRTSQKRATAKKNFINILQLKFSKESVGFTKWFPSEMDEAKILVGHSSKSESALILKVAKSLANNLQEVQKVMMSQVGVKLPDQDFADAELVKDAQVNIDYLSYMDDSLSSLYPEIEKDKRDYAAWEQNEEEDPYAIAPSPPALMLNAQQKTQFGLTDPVPLKVEKNDDDDEDVIEIVDKECCRLL